LTDLAIIITFDFDKFFPGIHWFTEEDLIKKEVLMDLELHKQVNFIGFYPDSLLSKEIYYWFPSGTFKGILSPAGINRDPYNGFMSRTEIKISISGQKGISGGPVIMQDKGKWKILGIISCGKELYCTSSYKTIDLVNSCNLK